MLSINPNEYVDYDIGASLPEGLSYVEGQGLIIYGAQHSSQQRLQLTINPDALQGSKNLFDSSKGQLNSELYDQMSLPDGMTFNKTDGLRLYSSNTDSYVSINPNSVIGITELFDANTKKVNKNISSLPTGLTYSSNSGLEITGATSNESLVIDANGFSQKTNLFNSGSSKINEDLYDAGEGGGVPDWVTFNEELHSVGIIGLPTESSGILPILHLNAGSLERTSYLVDTKTKALRGVLPEGMTFSPATGLTLENTGGGRITIPVGDGVFKGQAELFRFTDYVPDPYVTELSSPNADYYVACNVPTYLTTSGSNSVLHSSLSGYYFNNEDGTTKRITNVGGASIHLWEYDKSKKETKDIVVINDDGLDPDGIKTGIDADKITKGTLTRPIEITDESFGQKMMINASTIHCQNKVVTSTTSGYYDTFNLLNRRDDTNQNFHVTMKMYDWVGQNTEEKLAIGLNYSDIGSTKIPLITHDRFQITGEAVLNFFDEDSNLTLDSNGIIFNGTKSVFRVYPSGNVAFYGVTNPDHKTQIIRNCIECLTDPNTTKTTFFRSMNTKERVDSSSESWATFIHGTNGTDDAARVTISSKSFEAWRVPATVHNPITD